MSATLLKTKPQADRTDRRVVNVVALPNTRQPRTKPPVQDDEVFFHRGQIAIGTKLVNMGRLEPGTVWEVTRHLTFASLSYSAVWRLSA